MWAITISALLLAVTIWRYGVDWVRAGYVPPAEGLSVQELVAWMGRPWWVTHFKTGSGSYYTLGRCVSPALLLATLSSGAPSYTVNEAGRLVGWSRDSGDIREPAFLFFGDVTRETIPVDDFMAAWGLSPNEAGHSDECQRPGAAAFEVEEVSTRR
jgi:hypothetical protein